MNRTILTAIYLVSVSGAALVAAQSRAQDVVQLETITVHGSQDEVEDVLETDTEITQEDIERRQPTDLKQLFRETPSVSVSGGAPASQKIYVHGVDQSKLNVTIDGARQKNNVWHHNGNIGLNPIFLKSVGVNEGVAPADVGPGALGGAVRFETVGARDLLKEGQTLGGLTSFTWDTNSRTFTATGAAYQALNGFEILGALTRAEGDDYTAGSGQTEPGTGTDLWSGLGKASYQSVDGHRFDLSAEYYRDYGFRRLRTNMGPVGNPTGSLFNDNTYERLTTTAKYTVEGADGNFDPEILFYYNFNKLFRPDNPSFPFPVGDFNSDVQSFGGHAQNTFHLKLGDITAGVDFYNDDSSVERFNDVPGRFLAGWVSENVTNVGAYVQARLEPWERWMVSTGLRADFQSYRAVDGQTFDNFGLSPNINVGYEILPGLTANAGYAYVFGGIEQAETALFHAFPYIYSSDLDPTYAHNAKVGLSYRKNGLSLGANLFYIKTINSVAYDYSGSWPFVRINGDDLTSRGVDLFARYDWPNAFVQAAFSYSDVEYGDRIALFGDYNNGVPVGSILTLGAGYTFESYNVTIGADAEIAFEYSDDDLADNGYTNPLPGYQVVNLYAEWQPTVNNTDLTLRAAVNNLFDDNYFSRGTYAESAAVTPVYSPGRSFEFTVSAKF